MVFDAWCDCCNAVFSNISHEDNSDFLAWVSREANSARLHGWTETKNEVFCPNFDKVDFLAKLERKKASDAKEDVLAARRTTWGKRLRQVFKKDLSKNPRSRAGD